jgi:glycine/D-amino acid oxidase-like deaminating enzyme
LPDIVIVGGGILGASICYHLARRGAPVTLIDPAPGAGVTRHSFAWIGGAGGDWPGRAAAWRGSVLADYRRLAADMPGLTVRWTGSLTWRGTPEPLAGGQRWVDRDEIRRLEPGLRNPPEHAVHTPTDGGVDPVRVTRALIAAAAPRRITATVTGIATGGVHSTAGFHPATTIVLAAGTQVRRLCRPLGVDLPITVSPATLSRFTGPPGLVRGIVAGPDVEVREVEPGRLLATGPVSLARLQDAFRGAETCRLVDRHTAPRPMPESGPLLGYLTPDRSVYVAVMHSAVTLAPTAGRIAADEILGAGA